MRDDVITEPASGQGAMSAWDDDEFEIPELDASAEADNTTPTSAAAPSVTAESRTDDDWLETRAPPAPAPAPVAAAASSSSAATAAARAAEDNREPLLLVDMTEMSEGAIHNKVQLVWTFGEEFSGVHLSSGPS